MTKKQLLEKFKTNNLPTEQVFVPLNFVLEQIEQLEEIGGELTDDQIQEIAEEAAESLNDCGLDLVHDYDLVMSYREVELDSISFEQDTIISEIEKAIKSALKK